MLKSAMGGVIVRKEVRSVKPLRILRWLSQRPAKRGFDQLTFAKERHGKKVREK
jgi:hypothetical protein